MINKGWRERKLEIEKHCGDWYSYDIVPKGKNFYLTDSRKHKAETSVHFFEKIVNFAEDFLKTRLSRAKVLDLGCAEGVASFAFSRNSKNVLGIEGRYENIVKALFTKELLGLKNIDFLEQDLRTLNFPSKSFDLVLALGILYHFDAPDLFHFIENLYRWTKEITIIDTQISFLPIVKQTLKGKDYFGIYYDELEPIKSPQSSIGNKKSFWLTKSSLFNILKRVGYSEIYECKLPKIDNMRQADDRLTLIATKMPHYTSSLFRPKNINKLEAFGEYDPQIAALQYTNGKALEEMQQEKSREKNNIEIKNF